MTIEEAIDQINLQSDFLRLSYIDTVEMIKKEPLSMPYKTIQAIEVLKRVKLVKE